MGPRSCIRCDREIGHAPICPTCEAKLECDECEHTLYCLSGRLPTKGCKDEPRDFIARYLKHCKIQVCEASEAIHGEDRFYHVEKEN
jgi:hypothetical protein